MTTIRVQLEAWLTERAGEVVNDSRFDADAGFSRTRTALQAAYDLGHQEGYEDALAANGIEGP